MAPHVFRIYREADNDLRVWAESKKGEKEKNLTGDSAPARAAVALTVCRIAPILDHDRRDGKYHNLRVPW